MSLENRDPSKHREKGNQGNLREYKKRVLKSLFLKFGISLEILRNFDEGKEV
jgi:hypothetical protein